MTADDGQCPVFYFQGISSAFEENFGLALSGRENQFGLTIADNASDLHFLYARVTDEWSLIEMSAAAHGGKKVMSG